MYYLELVFKSQQFARVGFEEHTQSCAGQKLHIILTSEFSRLVLLYFMFMLNSERSKLVIYFFHFVYEHFFLCTMSARMTFALATLAGSKLYLTRFSDFSSSFLERKEKLPPNVFSKKQKYC